MAMIWTSERSAYMMLTCDRDNRERALFQANQILDKEFVMHNSCMNEAKMMIRSELIFRVKSNPDMYPIP